MMPIPRDIPHLFSMPPEDWNRFLAEIAHKMKNKLGGIHGFASLLEKELPAGDPRQRLAQKIQDGILQLNDVVVDFMKAVQPPEPEFKSVNVAAVIADAWADHAKAFPNVQPEVLPWAEGQFPSISAVTDADVLYDAVLQCLRFFLRAEWRVLRVFVESTSLHFICDSGVSSGTVSLQHLVLHSRSFEMRLALAVAASDAAALGGSLSVEPSDSGETVLSIRLNRGNTT
jgi:hypothetical protein